MEAATGSSLFEVVDDKVNLVTIKFTEPSDLKSAVNQINKLHLPSKYSFSPSVPSSIKSIKPNQKEISKIRGKASESLFYGLGLMAAGAAGIYFSAFSLFIFCAPLIVWGWFMAINFKDFGKNHFTEERKNKLNILRRNLEQASYLVDKRAHSTLFVLKSLVLDYNNLKISYSNLEKDYKTVRRAHHLDKYLAGKLIKNEKIPQVRRESVDNLISYGIESAADVKSQRYSLENVPSIGPVRRSRLIEWLDKKEKSFSFNETSKYTNLDISLLNTEKQKLIQKRDQIFDEMKLGLKKFNTQYAALQSTLTKADSALLSHFKAFYQAEVNLLEFGSISKLPIPKQSVSISVDKPRASVRKNAWEGNSTRSFYTPSTKTSGNYRKQQTKTRSSSSSNPNCPKCGSNMVRRVARRGYNAGGQFWGCSSYPSCRGTRS